MLFITSSRLDHLEQAHAEAFAQTEVQTRKASTVHRDTNKEGTGLRRSPMAISEKSAVGSPETRRSRSVVDHHSSPST